LAIAKSSYDPNHYPNTNSLLLTAEQFETVDGGSSAGVSSTWYDKLRLL